MLNDAKREYNMHSINDLLLVCDSQWKKKSNLQRFSTMTKKTKQNKMSRK